MIWEGGVHFALSVSSVAAGTVGSYGSGVVSYTIWCSFLYDLMYLKCILNALLHSKRIHVS